MNWGKRTIQGVEFDWTHLDDHILHVHMDPEDPEAESYRVLVRYGHHCFAREWRADDHADFAVFNELGSDKRCACPERTAQSRNLRQILRDAIDGLAYFSHDTNMVIVDAIPGVAGPYAVFFNVNEGDKSGHEVMLFVASAYIKPDLLERLSFVPFKALIAKAAKGHTPFRPKKTKSWKNRLKNQVPDDGHRNAE